MSTALPRHVRIVEVGPRDGLQNEKAMVSTADKIELIDRLSATGLQSIEATSFVSPKWVPQLADAADVFRGISRRTDVHYPVLVPNETGYDRARAVGVEEIAVFTAASEAFNQKNINASIEQSLARFAPVLARAASRSAATSPPCSAAPTRATCRWPLWSGLHVNCMQWAVTRSHWGTRSASARPARRGRC